VGIWLKGLSDLVVSIFAQCRFARMMNRKRCDDAFWVCEAHDTLPWRDCECGAPGIVVTLDDKGPRN
jgi:hypothetical protein